MKRFIIKNGTEIEVFSFENESIGNQFEEKICNSLNNPEIHKFIAIILGGEKIILPTEYLQNSIIKIDMI